MNSQKAVKSKIRQSRGEEILRYIGEGEKGGEGKEEDE